MLRFFPWSWILASPWHTARRLLRAWRAAKRGEGRIGRYAQSRPIAGLAWAILRAWFSALMDAPRTLIERRRILSRRTISTREFEGLLRRFRAPLSEMAFI